MTRSTAFALILLAAALFAGVPASAAEPTLHEVYQAASAGNLKQAESMMDQVLRDHPNSAKAHFVYAEILAKEGRLPMAKAELATAERLAPGLPFATKTSVDELKARFEAPARLAPAAPVAAPPQPANEFPWGMLLLGGALLAAVVFFVRSLNRPQVVPAAAGTAYGPGYGPTYGGGYGPVGPAPAGGMGSGILGGLATGAAVGAGIVAGEALMHKVLGDGQPHVDAAPAAQPLDSFAPSADYDMGGSDFGVSDGGSWDDGSSGGGDWN